MADENVDSGVAQDAESIQAEVDAALEKDPQRQLAKRIEENLREAGVDDPAKKPDGEETPEEFEAAKARVRDALAKRNQVFKERESARQEAESIKQEAVRMKTEAESLMKQIQNHQAGFRQWQMAMRNDPASALRAIGMDPEEFILNIARAGTPEYAQMRKLQEQEDKIRQFEEWKKSQEDGYRKQQEELERKQAEQHRSSVETEFMTKASAGKYGNVKKALEAGLISKDSLINQGHAVADQYREAVGSDCSLEDILEYIDSQFGTAISKLSGTSQVKAPVEDKPSRGASGNSMSQDEAGERRALSRDLRSADSDERREAAKQAVSAVLKKTATREKD